MSKKIYILAFFLFIGFLLRVYRLGDIPFGFHDDEVDAGYMGRYILLHGEDIKGNFLPIYYDKLGDFRPAGIFYLSGLSTFIFGINEFAVRFPSAFFGFLTIFVLYSFVYELFRDKRIALFSSFILMFSPWHIVLSRATSEGIVGLCFFMIGLVSFIKGIRKLDIKYFGIAFLFFFISYFFYHSFRVLIPLVLVPFIFFKTSIGIKRVILLMTLFFFLLGVGISFTTWGRGRFDQVAFYRSPTIINRIEQLAFSEDKGDKYALIKARLFHNKVVMYGREFLKEYAKYYSPGFLFLNGGEPLRYMVPEQGLFFVTVAPFILIGFLFLFSNNKKTFYTYYLLYLLFIAPIVSALTIEESPNIHRALFLIIPFVILAGTGLMYVFSVLEKKRVFFRWILYSVFLFEFIYFYHQYFVHVSTMTGYFRKDTHRELAKILVEKKNSYDVILVPDVYDIGIYYLFYDKQFKKLSSLRVGEDNWIERIDNIIFSKEACPSEKLQNFDLLNVKRVLIIDIGSCSYNELHFERIETILRYGGGIEAFRILTPLVNKKK